MTDDTLPANLEATVEGADAVLVSGNAGEDLHVVGSMAPLIDGAIGCIVIQPDGSRYLARVMRDPLAQSG